MKKLFAILLALAMIFAMSTTAFAAEDETYTLTITGATGHTYEVYQIFTGDIAKEGDETVLSNVLYGENYGDTGTAVEPDVLEELSKSQNLATILKNSVHGTPKTVTPAEGESTIHVTGLVAGYYLVRDITTDAAMPDGQTKSDVILQVVESVTIASKHASIVSTKKVDDKNDSTNAEDGYNWQDAADYDIGDAVPFQMTVTLPTTLTGYATYELTIHDKQAAGFNAPVISEVYILKADNTTKITIPEAAEGTHGYTLSNTCPKTDTCEYKDEGGCTFNIHVGDIIALYGENTFADGDMLVIDYTSVLNQNAEVGNEGNINSMYVCHPDGHTPKDAVTVLTYALTVNKIDGASKEALQGAGFTLEKWNAATGVYESLKVGEDAEGNDIFELKGAAMTSFVWSGIDGGKYRLVETTTPAGYNTIAPIEFVVDATHKTEWLADGNNAFEDLIAKNLAGDTVVFADKHEGVEDGKLEGNVENYKGTILPETGAEGTFFMIAGGAMLVMVAAVFMVTRKKMSIYED